MTTSQANGDSDARLDQAMDWLAEQAGRRISLQPIAVDASFRRYFRVQGSDRHSVLMDAPPGKEDSRPFVEVCARLLAGGVRAPEILARDLDRGFLLLDDLGDSLFRDILTTNNADVWFPRFFDLLERMARHTDAEGLPPYGRQRFLEEMELLPRWYLQQHKAIEFSCEDWDIWEDLCTRLIASALEQPAVFVHKDFHSCNLLLTPDGDIGVIDFQDAVRGPLTYDFISLLWDRYIAWPRHCLEAWMEEFRQRMAPETDPSTWARWCDWMGLQRNLKVVGIFARLHYRDGKQGYLDLIPRFWSYLEDVLPRYPETRPFGELLRKLQCAP